MIVPGQKAIVVGIEPVSIHGQLFFDVALGEIGAGDACEVQWSARLGEEAVEGGPAPGDRVAVEGFLSVVTGIRRLP